MDESDGAELSISVFSPYSTLQPNQKKSIKRRKKKTYAAH